MCTQTESLLFFFFSFSRKLWPLFYFFGSLYRSYLSNEKKKKTKKSRLSVCWLMHDQHRVKKHVKIRSIERGIANPPLYAFLGWYSSYDVHVVWPFPLERVPYFLMIVLHSNSPYYSYMPSCSSTVQYFFHQVRSCCACRLRRPCC